MQEDNAKGSVMPISEVTELMKLFRYLPPIKESKIAPSPALCDDRGDALEELAELFRREMSGDDDTSTALSHSDLT